MLNPPRSARDKTGGMPCLARRLDPIRLFQRGGLRPDFHANPGRGAAFP